MFDTRSEEQLPSSALILGETLSTPLGRSMFCMHKNLIVIKFTVSFVIDMASDE